MKFVTWLCLVGLAFLAKRLDNEHEIVAQATLPTYTVYRLPAGESITIDGILNEPAWKQTPSTTTFVVTSTGTRSLHRTTANVLWSDSLLYCAFECSDPDIVSSMTKRDDLLFREEVVEMFIAGGPLEDGYCELEISPRNVIMDLYVLRADNKGTPAALPYHVFTLNVTSAVVINGTLNKSDDIDTGWTVEFVVPIADLRQVFMPMPKNGEIWRCNFYRADLKPERELSAWSWTGLPKFHVPEKFGFLQFSTTPVNQR